MLAKIEATLIPPPRKWLQAIIDDTDDEAEVKEKKEKALAEHVARHPEDVGRTVEDFNWILHVIRLLRILFLRLGTVPAGPDRVVLP